MDEFLDDTDKEILRAALGFERPDVYIRFWSYDVVQLDDDYTLSVLEKLVEAMRQMKARHDEQATVFKGWHIIEEMKEVRLYTGMDAYAVEASLLIGDEEKIFRFFVSKEVIENIDGRDAIIERTTRGLMP